MRPPGAGVAVLRRRAPLSTEGELARKLLPLSGTMRAFRSRRALAGWAIALVVIASVAALVLHVVDEPVRRHMEQQLNASLKGYAVRIGRLRLHLIGGSVDLLDSTLAQTAHPDPPVAHVPRLHASVHWPALLHG